MSRLRRARRAGAAGWSLAGAAALVLLVPLLVPASATAHARLVRSVPAAGAVLERQPPSVAFSFSEPVEAAFGVIRVFGPQGVEVQAGVPFRPPGQSNALEIALQPGLPDGTYSATYRLVSADSYPVSGGTTFSIGAPSSGSTAAPPGAAGAARATSTALWADRWLGFGAIGIVVGGLFFLVFAWRPALAGRAGGNQELWLQVSASFDRSLRRLIGVAVAVGLTASLVALPLQGASALDTSFRGGLDGNVLDQIAHTRFGSLMLVRAAAWALLGGVLAVAAGRGRVPGLHRRASPESIALAMLPIGSLLVSPALAGHARTQSPRALLFPADVLHVTAMSLWLGGLAALAIAVPAGVRLLEPAERNRLLTVMLGRFSLVALGSVGVLAGSGAAQAVFEVGSVPALVETGYGRIVVAKILLLAVLVGYGAVNRERLIPALAGLKSPGRSWQSLRRNVRIEMALIAVVLGVTAVLVGFAPASESGVAAPPPQGRVTGRTTIGDAILRYTVDPARVGLNQLNLYLLRPGGRPFTQAKQIRVELLSLPDEGGVPRLVRLERVGPGHYTNSATQFDAAGRWQISVLTTGTSRSGSDVAELQVAIG